MLNVLSRSDQEYVTLTGGIKLILLSTEALSIGREKFIIRFSIPG